MRSIRSYFMARFYDASMEKCETLCLGRWRAELLGGVTGEVLEIGAGTGVNLQYYPDPLQRLVLSEPEPNMRRQLGQRVRESGRDATLVTGDGADSLDLPDESFDSVVSTLVLCSVPDPQRSIGEIHRVLRPGGALFFIEHVSATGDPKLMRWQRFFEPFWTFCCGNCHLTRETQQTIQDGRLSFEKMERTVMDGAPPVVRPVIIGVARKTDI